VVAGVEDAVILADQFLFGVLTDLAELFVHVGNCALYVSHRYNRVLIKSKLLDGQLFQRILACKAFVHLFSLLQPKRHY
jgi:hypothetical protein